MAWHPEEFYAGLSKISQYAEESLEFWENFDSRERERPDTFHRSFLFSPVVIIKDNLIELTADEQGNCVFNPVPYSRLMFTYHYKDDPKSAMIYFVTQNGLDSFIDYLLSMREKAEETLIIKVKNYRTEKFP